MFGLIIAAVLLIYALKHEPLSDALAGSAGLLIVYGLLAALFWACVILPEVFITLITIGTAGTTLYLLQRFTLSNSRIGKTIEKRRRQLGYDK